MAGRLPPGQRPQRRSSACTRGSWPCGSGPPDARSARHTDGPELPACWLLAEWPATEPEPVQFWLSNLPADTPLATLVRPAKLRWRIEHDYREMKQALGLDHFEGRTWQGWHHHVTLVSAAHAFCTLQRLTRSPKETAPA